MKILNSILTLACLGGMVSCYPVAPTDQNGLSKKKTVSQDSPAAIAKKKAAAAAKRKAAAAKKKANSTPAYDQPFSAPNLDDSSADNSSSSDSSTSSSDASQPKEQKKKPVIALSVKTAKKVPGKDGFVFNPYTHNQVDVRGIPSGTKVRDPHDSNPAHVFRVP